MSTTNGIDRQEIYDAVLAAIEQERDTIMHVADSIHARPELAMQERFACDLLASTIERYDFAVERQAGGVETAFKARIGGTRDKDGPAIAFLAEYDALPGIGHGCGHNLIASSNLAAAIGVSAVLDRLPGSVMLIGTPAEEAIGGKVMMINGGAFDDVDIALSSHHAGDATEIATEAPQGTCLAITPIRFEYRGRTAHAAADPHNGINALNAVIHLFTGLDALRQHVTSDVRIHGIITDGGKAPNIVPDFAAADFYFRAATKEGLDALITKGLAVAEAAATMTGTTLTVETGLTYDDVRPNYTLGRLVQSKLEAVGLKEYPGANGRRSEHGPGPYSTDLGNVSRKVPTAALQFAISETPIRGHSTEVTDASISELGRENALKTGKALALAAVDLLLDAEKVKEIQDEFARS
jgi:amidohydrolase